MKTSKSKKLPKLKSIAALVRFTETHDMGDYMDSMPEVHFDVDIKSRQHYVRLNSSVASRLEKFARSRKVPAGKLVNSWVGQKLKTASR